MLLPAGPLALAPGLGWTLGVLAGVALALYGGRILRRLARRGVHWWGSVAAPLLLVGPALGVLLGCWLTGAPLLWGLGAEHAPANVAWTVLLFFAVATSVSLARAFLQHPFVTGQIGVRLPDLVLDGVRYLLYLATVFVIVGVVWGRTDWFQPLFTASAVGTVILGFALQETLANFFAGMSLLAERVYAIGDWVWIGEHEGEVVAISRRSTRLRTRAGDVITLSNRTVASGTLRNQSKPTPLHAELLQVSAPYGTPPNRVREVLLRALEDVEGVLREPAPRVRLKRFADSGIDYEVKVWVENLPDLHDILSDARIQFWYHLRRAGIAFPYPVRELVRAPAGGPSAPPPEAVRARLAAVDLFAALPPEALDVLARGARAEDFAAGERIVRQGAPGRSCWVVDAGRLAVLLEEGGATRSVATFEPGALFGEMSLLTGEARTATVRALSDARLIEVDAAALREALLLAPDLAGRMAEVVALRKEGLAEARAALSADARARVQATALRLGDLIRHFFRLGPPRGR